MQGSIALQNSSNILFLQNQAKFLQFFKSIFAKKFHLDSHQSCFGCSFQLLLRCVKYLRPNFWAFLGPVIGLKLRSLVILCICVFFPDNLASFVMPARYWLQEMNDEEDLKRWHEIFSRVTGCHPLRLDSWCNRNLDNIYNLFHLSVLEGLALILNTGHQHWPTPPRWPMYRSIFDFDHTVAYLVYMGQVTKLRLSCYLVLLSIDSKTR